MGRPKKKRTYPLIVARYKERTFTRIYAEIRKEIVAEFKELAAANGDTTQGVIKKAVNDYIAEHRDNKNEEE